MPDIKHINPPQLYDPPGYTHVVEVSGGRTVYIAGQVATDPDGNLVGAFDFQAQVTQVFENLKIALQAVGGDFSNVVKFNFYVKDMKSIQHLREVRDQYVTGANPPASTLVEIGSLASPDYLVEIEAIAVLPLE